VLVFMGKFLPDVHRELHRVNVLEDVVAIEPAAGTASKWRPRRWRGGSGVRTSKWPAWPSSMAGARSRSSRRRW
jgi:hypothetical protein